MVDFANVERTSENGFQSCQRQLHNNLIPGSRVASFATFPLSPFSLTVLSLLWTLINARIVILISYDFHI
jgi:hypothetical protein